MSEKKSEKLNDKVKEQIMKWLQESGHKIELSPEEPPGVLVSSEIIELCSKDPPLVANLPADLEEMKRRLKPAAIHLSLGRVCRIGRKTVLLDESKKPYLRIEPYQVAIVETREKLNMPNNLIARWNLSIGSVYKGLLWVGGPQVDPGFRGNLVCPLYNLSTDPVTLEFGEPFATIDFVRIAPGTLRDFPQKRFKMSDYSSFESAPEDTVRMVRETRHRMEIFEASTLASIGILIAALAILTTSQLLQIKEVWPAVVWIVLAAIVTFVSGFVMGLVARKGN